MSLSPAERNSLIRAAFEAKDKAYSPYSHFPVGAALLARDGTIIQGCSVDNANYADTICAERVAIVKAAVSSNVDLHSYPTDRSSQSSGTTNFLGTRHHIVSNKNLFSAISPCGLCRQVLGEFCGPDMLVLLVPGDYPASDVRETTLGELFPS
ncbi:cytidine deaminase-like protein [Armillaria novae-zelandiae]|uniref:Cytidine deaminase-like protein n=1 Tax=Armillaria novae-zelandiae TaxID=153914 RepID=A0AA39NJ96_9AGAR|nr:cytidine deaminase-like protein [Armillaria novae-zelandiae]